MCCDLCTYVYTITSRAYFTNAYNLHCALHCMHYIITHDICYHAFIGVKLKAGAAWRRPEIQPFYPIVHSLDISIPYSTTSAARDPCEAEHFATVVMGPPWKAERQARAHACPAASACALVFGGDIPPTARRRGGDVLDELHGVGSAHDEAERVGLCVD